MTDAHRHPYRGNWVPGTSRVDALRRAWYLDSVLFVEGCLLVWPAIEVASRVASLLGVDEAEVELALEVALETGTCT
jgi:hypothetical protein